MNGREWHPPSGWFVDQIRPAANLQPGAAFAWDLFSAAPGDVTLYYYWYTSRSQRELDREQMEFTLLVDYQPVQAHWVRWDFARTDVLADSTGSSLTFADPHQFELLDITIPATAFPSAQAYEISFAAAAPGEGLYPQTSTWRLVLYNGGYSRPRRPCAPPPHGGRLLPIETALQADVGDDQVLIFPQNIDRVEQGRGEPLRVAGGATVRFFASVMRVTAKQRVTVLQPTLNGTPVGQPIWVQQGGGPVRYQDGRYPFIDARFKFHVTVPKNSGRYDVGVLSWRDPYETYRDLNGDRVEGVDNGAVLQKGSNLVTLQVQADGLP